MENPLHSDNHAALYVSNTSNNLYQSINQGEFQWNIVGLVVLILMSQYSGLGVELWGV